MTLDDARFNSSFSLGWVLLCDGGHWSYRGDESKSPLGGEINAEIEHSAAARGHPEAKAPGEKKAG